MNLPDLLPHSKAEAVSDVIAVGAVASPLWLHQVSELAAQILPIAGVIWLAVQIGIKIHTTYWRR